MTVEPTETTEAPEGPASYVVRELPPRAAVLESEIELAERQLNGYVRTVRAKDRVVGEEIELPAQGATREALLAEIDRLKRHLESLRTQVLLPDLVVKQDTTTSAADAFH